jgi:hypothetical protein
MGAVADQLVEFLRTGEIEPALHIAADLFDRGDALDAFGSTVVDHDVAHC